MRRLTGHPVFWLCVAAVHLYLSVGHLSSFFGGETTFTHAWKGFGALAGAALMTRMGLRARRRS